MKKTLLLILLIFVVAVKAQITKEVVYKEISAGNFNNAENLINNLIASDKLSELDKADLLYQVDLMNRIKLDFRKTLKDVKTSLIKYFPDLTDEQLEKWEKDGSLEMKLIDGEKRYFNNAVPNLFRINNEAKEVKIKIDGSSKGSLESLLEKYLPKAVKTIKKNKLGMPLNITLNYTVTLDENAIPEDEIVRCWLPFPKENHQRQSNVKLLGVNSNTYVLSNDKNLQRSIYLEQKTIKDKPTVFNVKYSFTSRPEFHNLSNAKIKDYIKSSNLYKTFTSEEAPHIIFTDKIKKISSSIKQNETNPYLIVKNIVEWFTKNIPWASAREYSTLENISDYCFSTMHGDCGIKALTFITIARYCGIPAKWQSGWMLHPGSVNLHDWAEVYFEGVGWVPVDPDFGIQPSENNEVKYFYTCGIDNFRFIVNDGISAPFFPAKTYPRSEPYDFQRGELEWRLGNIYFDKWNYHMDVNIEGMK